MATQNTQLFRSLTQLWRTRQSATLVVEAGRNQRSLHVDAGHFVAADSDLLTERIGVQLVAEGRIEPAQVAPVVEAARASGRAFGEQLVADHLLAEAELRAALQRQFTSRLDRTLRAAGPVQLTALRASRRTVHQPVPAAVVATFRRVPVDVATQIVSSLPPSHARMRDDLFAAEHLQLLGEEPRYFRQMAAGMDATAVLDRAQDHEGALRLCAALVSLGAIPVEVEDPIAQYLRTA